MKHRQHQWNNPANAVSQSADPPSDARNFIELESKRIPVPRREMDGFVRELLLSYPLEKNGVEIQGGSVYIPFSQILQGVFSRNAHTQDEEDSGIENAMAFKGYPGSMISDRVRLAFAEKSHTMYYPGRVPDASKARLEAERAAQTAAMRKRAVAERQAKLTALAGEAGAVGPQVITAGKDAEHLKAVREFAAANEGQPAAALWAAMNASVSELGRRQARTTAKEPMRSSIGCLHFENEDVMTFTDHGVEVPLNRKIVAYRGRLAAYPNEEYQMSTGVAVFYHNRASNSLDIYFGFSGIVEIRDSNAGFVAEFAVGPADGAAWPIAPEGRPTSFFPPMVENVVEAGGRAMTAIRQAIPTDFSFLHSNREDVGCSDTVLEILTSDSGHLQTLLRAINTPLENMTVVSQPLLMIPTMVNAYKSALDWVRCAVEYLRPVEEDHPVALSTLSVMGLFHVLSELAPADIASIMNSAQGWNKVLLSK